MVRHGRAQGAELYPSASRAEIEAAVPRHSWHNIGGRAQLLGVRRRPARVAGVPRHPLIAELRALRIAQGVSKSRLVAAAGIERAAIINAESGRRLPNLKTVTRWCEALGVELTLLRRAPAPEAAE